jgi:hypothetical protein
MGLDINNSKFLIAEKKRGLSLGRTLTLGRQEVYMTPHEYTTILENLGVKQTEKIYGDDFFRGLGVDKLSIMDASNYEGAEVIHDLNTPIGTELRSSFDTVIDGGTLEHVFHFPNSIKNCMELVKLGGHLILMTPWHNHSGHGFYQFSPELFYNILCPTNGYTIERMLIVTEGYWYSIRNPADIKRRVELSTNDPIDIYVLAKRINSNEIFEKWPQQSDYSDAWKQGSYGDTNSKASESLKTNLVNKLPFLQELQSRWRRLKSRRAISPSKNPGLVKICKSREIPL